MDEKNTESLWERIEKYDAGESLLGKIKSYTVAGLYLGFFFIFIPVMIAFPLARSFGDLGDFDLSGVLYIVTVVVIYLAGKSIRFERRDR